MICTQVYKWSYIGYYAIKNDEPDPKGVNACMSSATFVQAYEAINDAHRYRGFSLRDLKDYTCIKLFLLVCDRAKNVEHYIYIQTYQI